MKSNRIGVIAAVLAMLVIVTGCSTRAPSDSMYLYYASGVGDDKKFVECIEPGTSGKYPVDDEIFEIPTSMRTWNVRPEGGDTTTPITSGTLPVNDQPGAEVVVFTTTDFYLNTDCSQGADSPVVKFWEQTGRRYGIATNGEDGFNIDGFRTMLVNTLVSAQEKATRTETRKYEADDLDANLDAVWTTMERNLAPGFGAELRAKLGGDFFCGVGYARGAEVEWTEWERSGADDAGKPTYREVAKKGTCPPVRITITDINYADPKIGEARTRVFTEKQNAEAERIKAQAERDRARILGEAANSPNYVELQRIEAQKLAAEACRTNQNCTVIIDQSGQGVARVAR